MDNASKALIMAGAILIAVAIVGIGIYIFSASNSLTNDAVDQIDTIAVQMFNNNFYQYAVDEEVVNGTRAAQLLNAVKANSAVALEGTFKSGGTPTPTKSYKVEYETDLTSGYVYQVTITEQARTGS